jgi:BirA family biotin operon repressor/biotin-[acetyl-CoA-carboxylase] ligase
MKTNLIVHETLPTTMLEARAKAQAGHPEGTTILARAQTSGRGRHGRSWIAERDTGVWMTTILRPPPERGASFAELSLVAGIAVCKSVQAMGVAAARLKWPNDVLVGDKKLAGILLESDGNVVLVGIGLNLARAAGRTLPAEVAAVYTGLLDHVATPPWEGVAKPNAGEVEPDASLAVPAQGATEPGEAAVVYAGKALMNALATWYDRWKAHGFSKLTDVYAGLDALKDSDVRVAATDGTQVEGKARGVNAEGLLRVETPRGITEVRAGEVERVRR